MTTNKIRLLIADDHEVVRSGLKTMLTGTEAKVVGEVFNGRGRRQVRVGE